MEKTYEIKPKEKQKLKINGYKLSQYYEDSKLKRFILIKFFIVFPIIVLLAGPYIATLYYNDINEGFLVGMGPGLSIAFPLWMVAAFYFKIVQAKTMPYCCDYGQESLILKDDELVYTVDYTYNCTRIIEKHILFDKISRIEVNDRLRKISIYGYYYANITDNLAVGQVIPTLKVWNKDMDKEILAEVPMYYEDIDELIKILEESSGVKAVHVREVKVPNGRRYKYVEQAV